MNSLAIYYYNGQETEKNLEKAFYWFQKAAENDNEATMFFLANCYKIGEGIEKNLEKAFYWYQKAAEYSNEVAMLHLAKCYYDGEGIEKNLEEAFYWYQKAAENDHIGAMSYLAICYNNGEGTEKNEEKAFYWFQRAAENGDNNAMNRKEFYNGEGTEMNLEKAFYWFQKAAENGNKEAIRSLAICYTNGEGAEKNLEKVFYFLQELVEKNYVEAMYNLAICYYNGRGTEKNLEKAFYWFLKAIENGNEEAIRGLAFCYKNGEGTEKNLEKAFYWFQKAAENGDEKAMYILAKCYYNGEGIEKDFEKAFYWYQKASENGNENAMNNLANCYESGEGVEKNLEKAFYWYQKAVENGDKEAMNNLVMNYKNGEGIEKNLEKAFYWYQKMAESNKESTGKNELCNECKQPYIDYQWCQQCNSKRFQQDFLKWTSKNKFVDEFIKEAQLNAKNCYEVLEWIPYNKLSSINYHDKGGFSEINKAIWSDGPIDSWDFDKQQWNRWSFQTGYEVILKILNNSSSLNSKFLDEWKYHYNCQKKSFSKFIQFFGITQDPYNLNYIIVMSYAKKGNIRKCLPNIIKFKWQDRLQLLKNIILGLKVIHESSLTHGDFHDGNILVSDDYNEIFIIDLGLCKPINDLQNSDKIDNEIYGVLPYMAPEIIRKEPYTPASDIYSFSMIMWEFTSGIPPFDHEAHDLELSLSICEGERPKINKNTPQCYVDLMTKCWDSNPSNRPTITELEYKISEWIKCIDEYYRTNRDGDYRRNVPNIDSKFRSDMSEFVKVSDNSVQEQTNISIVQSHPQAYYTSRNLTEILFKDDSEHLDCMI
ncbi:Skt5p [Rhizophagus irregularis DAOM 197198w]|uniref:Skt5p n=1 Tax=Rhizophagus irregularis (strain DAOM 197198w) TaxID=1432141 RepID=A0A015L5T0_RHIIW|nr:Skt5p [Rhizophagus irregularis DAOM 197198w]